MKISEKVRQLEEQNKDLLALVERLSSQFRISRKQTIRNLLHSFEVVNEYTPSDGKTLPYTKNLGDLEEVTLNITQPCIRRVKTGDEELRSYYTNKFSITLHKGWSSVAPKYNWILDSEYTIIEKVNEFDGYNKRTFWLRLPTNIIDC